jgi:hypothetical protein
VSRFGGGRIFEGDLLAVVLLCDDRRYLPFVGGNVRGGAATYFIEGIVTGRRLAHGAGAERGDNKQGQWAHGRNQSNITSTFTRD